MAFNKLSSVKKMSSSHINQRGIHWIVGAIFIVGETAGGGMIALPKAMTSTGLVPGTFLLLVCGIFSTYTALELSWTWKIMQERWIQYRNHCRQPYGEMAYRAVGNKTRSFIGLMLCLTQLGFACVLLLLSAKNLSIILHFFAAININQCYLIMIVAVGVWPMTMLPSPMDFWQAAVVSAASSASAVLFVAVGFGHDAGVCAKNASHDSSTLFDGFMAFGTLMFAYGGHATLPTIQHDLRKPAHFVYSVVLALAICTTLYLIIGIGGYLVYGSSVGEAVIPSIQLMWVQQVVNLMIAFHVISTIVIVLSPPIQQIEQLFHVPHKFCVQRFAVRSIIFFTVVFVSLSVPHFGPLLDLIGASTMSTMTLILPPMFYLSLRTQQIKWNEKFGVEDDQPPSLRDICKLTPKPILLFNITILVFGICGAIVATITSIIKLTQSDMAAPCYVQYFKNGLPFSNENLASVNCCGAFRNLTTTGQSPIGYCSARFL